MKQSFRKEDKLTNPRQFKRILYKGNKVKKGCIELYSGKSADSRPRLGIIISAKVANSVNRNRIKRKIREFFRTHKEFLEGKEIVIRVKSPVSDEWFNEFEEAMKEAFEVKEWTKD